MVDRYCRKIESVENDIENSMQISSILLKLKGYDDKLSDLSKIGNNENNISSNLGKIDANENNISSNLGKVDTSKNNISSNLGKIDTNKNNISSNLGKIDTNRNNISSNLRKIDTNTSNIDEIKSNLSNIDFDSNNKFSIENFFIYDIELEKSFKLNKDKTSFSIFKCTLENSFKKDSILQIDCRLLYRYHNYNHIGLLQHIFKLYDGDNIMFNEYTTLLSNAGDNLSNDLKQNDLFYIKLDADYDVTKLELILSLIDNINTTVDCKICNKYKSNFLSIKYFRKINLVSVNNNLGDLENTVLLNSSKIDENNISSNLGKIDTNKNNMAYNLSEINYIKNNIPKSYLKSIYNILFYDEKTQINFTN